jgi:protein SCO1/2
MDKVIAMHGRRLSGLLATVTLGLAAAYFAPAAAAQPLPSFDRVRVLEAPRHIDDAELVDQDGKPFKLSALRGKVAFVLFGFTNCPDVCPITMERLRELQAAALLAKDQAAYVLISVDGERDTPPVMKEYLAKYSDEFIGLTADPNRVKSIATQFTAKFFKGGHTGHDDGYNVNHSPQIFVLDPAGDLRAEVFGASLESMAGVARALQAEAR